MKLKSLNYGLGIKIEKEMMTSFFTSSSSSGNES